MTISGGPLFLLGDTDASWVLLDVGQKVMLKASEPYGSKVQGSAFQYWWPTGVKVGDLIHAWPNGFLGSFFSNGKILGDKEFTSYREGNVVHVWILEFSEIPRELRSSVSQWTTALPSDYTGNQSAMSFRYYFDKVTGMSLHMQQIFENLAYKDGTLVTTTQLRQSDYTLCFFASEIEGGQAQLKYCGDF